MADPFALAAGWFLGRLRADAESGLWAVLRGLLRDDPMTVALEAVTAEAIHRAVSSWPGSGGLREQAIRDVAGVFDSVWPTVDVHAEPVGTLLDRIEAVTAEAVRRSAEPVGGLSEQFAPVSSLSALEADYGLVLDPAGFAEHLARCWNEAVKNAAMAPGSPLAGLAAELNAQLSHDKADRIEGKIDALGDRLANVGAAVATLGGRVVLPPPPLGDWGLVGRDQDLARLHATLQSHQSAAVVPVTGTGGLGKTALAQGYIAAYGERYGLIAWVEAERPDLIPGQYRRLVELRTGRRVDETDAVTAAKALLAGTQGWLVVFDNAVDRAGLEPLLPSGPGRVLVTTRDETWSPNLKLVVALDPLGEGTIAAWLNKALTDTRDQDAVQEIAGRLGGLPLAVAQTIAFINSRPGETTASYLGKLKDRDGQRLVYAANCPPGYPAPVAETWDIAVAQLAADTPAAVEVLGALAYIGPDGLPIGLLDGLIDGIDPPGVLSELRRYGLIRADSAQIAVHRLLQDVTRWSHTPNNTTAHLQRWAEHIETAAPDPQDPRQCDWYTELTPHLAALQDHAAEHCLTATAKARFNRAATIFLAVHAIILTSFGIVHRELGEHQQAREELQHAVDIKETVYGSDHAQVAITVTNLGFVHQQLGQHQQARALYERALAIFEAVYGTDHRHAAHVRRLLGSLDAPDQ